MPRPCSCCSHPRRGELDRAIVAGYRDITGRFGVTRSSISRHREHIADDVFAVARLRRADQAALLLGTLERIAEDARRMSARAEQEGRLSIALAGLKEITRVTEIMLNKPAIHGTEIEDPRALLNEQDRRILEEADRARRETESEVEERLFSRLLALYKAGSPLMDRFLIAVRSFPPETGSWCLAQRIGDAPIQNPQKPADA
jgi:hypothetical protein